MRLFLDKIIFVLILAKIDVLQSRALFGDPCSCAPSVPLAINIPTAPLALSVPCPTHGYKIEVPPAVPCVSKPSYPLDVVVEAPIPVAPPPVCNPSLLFSPIIKAPLPSPDCDVPAAPPAPCGCEVPAPCATSCPCEPMSSAPIPALALPPSPAPALAVAGAPALAPPPAPALASALQSPPPSGLLPELTSALAPILASALAPALASALAPAKASALAPALEPALAPPLEPLLPPAPAALPAPLPALEPALAPALAPPPAPAPGLLPTVTSALAPTLKSVLEPAIAPLLAPELATALAPALLSSLAPALLSSLTPALLASLTPALLSALAPALLAVLGPALAPALAPALMAALPGALLAALAPGLALGGAPLPLVDDFGGVAPLSPALPAPLTYAVMSPSLPAPPPPGPLPGAYGLPLLDAPNPYGSCAPPPPPPPCSRYVSKDIESNIISKDINSNSIYRSKRDVSAQSQKYIDQILESIKSLKATRVTRKAKKSKLVKRDIKGEYDLLQREQYQMDLTIPEIIQYMPETMLPNFKRGKCNIGCKNCINNNDMKLKFKNNNSENNSALTTETENTNKQNSQPTEQEEVNENTTESPNKQFDMSSQLAGESYLKRSVNPFQNSNPSYSGSMPPPYTSTTSELTKLAQNPSNPIWYKPQPLTDTNVEYVYDRLGHKYKVKNGSFKLVTPDLIDEVVEEVNNPPSTTLATATNTEKTTTVDTNTAEVLASSVPDANNQQMDELAEAQKMFDAAIQSQVFTDVNAQSVAKTKDQKTTSMPMVGAAQSQQHAPSSDPHMDKVIRDIVYRHPDFIDATQHAPGSLTLPEDVTRDETMHFLDKLIRGRLSKWFGTPNEEVPMHSLQDLNRYSRKTGTTIKFIPIVTVDKGRLDRYRETSLEETS